MAVAGLLYVFIFLKFCEICDSKLKNQFCALENNSIGKCVPIAFCPQAANLSKSDSDYLTRTCDYGTICCRVSAKIVTPTAGNPAPPVPSGPPTPSPEWVSVPPIVVNPNPLPPSIGASPPSEAGGATPPPSGTKPPTGAGVPPITSAAGPPPAGASSSGILPSVAPPPSGTPPNGASPPSGAAAGGPPPIMGSIVAGPQVPSRSLPPPNLSPSGTTGVSAEVIDNTIDSFDRKCDIYHSMLPSPPGISTITQLQTPIVMIYGGTNSAEKEFPHMTALGFGDPNSKRWLCAGSLITENYVLTAAHCLSAAPLGEVRYAKLGNIRLDQDTQNTQEFNIIGRKAHEQYDSNAQYNDIALVQLDRSVRITEYVLPICLFSSTNYEDKNLIASGWGKTESGSVSMNLKKVGLELFSQNECQNAYSVVPKQQLPLGIREATQVCAGSKAGGKDTCQGDSGGPLQIRKNNRWYLIGITSIGIQCGNANYPGVYTRLAYFLPWIQQNIWNK